jgi:fatty-acyl-CoA synthase
MKATPTTHDLPLLYEGFSTLAEALDYAAQGETGYNFYSGQGKLFAALSYAKLRDDALNLAKKLLSLNLPRGTRVALVADTHPDFVRFFSLASMQGSPRSPCRPQYN